MSSITIALANVNYSDSPIHDWERVTTHDNPSHTMWLQQYLQYDSWYQVQVSYTLYCVSDLIQWDCGSPSEGWFTRIQDWWKGRHIALICTAMAYNQHLQWCEQMNGHLQETQAKKLLIFLLFIVSWQLYSVY